MNKEERKEYGKQYREKNREKILERNRKYRKEHPEIYRKCNKKYYYKNKEKWKNYIKEHNRTKYNNDPEFRKKMLEYGKKYRERYSNIIKMKANYYKRKRVEKKPELKDDWLEEEQ